MDTKLIQSKFEKLGARARLRPMPAIRRLSSATQISVDIGTDRLGEFFDIQTAPQADIQILDVQPQDRHLLMMVCQPAEQAGMPAMKDKFLCGHDERHWFVAGIPEKSTVHSVITAKEALKPELVRNLERGQRVKRSKFHKRRTSTFVRQGEWFFIPCAEMVVQERLVLRKEPLRRGRGKPHICQFLYRQGGETVYVCGQYPNGMTEAERKKLFKSTPSSKKWNWRALQRDPAVYVRGKVSHQDHATIRLDNWHRFAMNTESQSRAMASVAFLD